MVILQPNLIESVEMIMTKILESPDLLSALTDLGIVIQKFLTRYMTEEGKDLYMLDCVSLRTLLVLSKTMQNPELSHLLNSVTRKFDHLSQNLIGNIAFLKNIDSLYFSLDLNGALVSMASTSKAVFSYLNKFETICINSFHTLEAFEGPLSAPANFLGSVLGAEHANPPKVALDNPSSLLLALFECMYAIPATTFRLQQGNTGLFDECFTLIPYSSVTTNNEQESLNAKFVPSNPYHHPDSHIANNSNHNNIAAHLEEGSFPDSPLFQSPRQSMAKSKQFSMLSSSGFSASSKPAIPRLDLAGLGGGSPIEPGITAAKKSFNNNNSINSVANSNFVGAGTRNASKLSKSASNTGLHMKSYTSSHNNSTAATASNVGKKTAAGVVSSTSNAPNNTQNSKNKLSRVRSTNTLKRNTSAVGISASSSFPSSTIMESNSLTNNKNSSLNLSYSNSIILQTNNTLNQGSAAFATATSLPKGISTVTAKRLAAKRDSVNYHAASQFPASSSSLTNNNNVNMMSSSVASGGSISSYHHSNVNSLSSHIVSDSTTRSPPPSHQQINGRAISRRKQSSIIVAATNSSSFVPPPPSSQGTYLTRTASHPHSFHPPVRNGTTPSRLKSPLRNKIETAGNPTRNNHHYHTEVATGKQQQLAMKRQSSHASLALSFQPQPTSTVEGGPRMARVQSRSQLHSCTSPSAPVGNKDHSLSIRNSLTSNSASGQIIQSSKPKMPFQPLTAPEEYFSMDSTPHSPNRIAKTHNLMARVNLDQSCSSPLIISGTGATFSPQLPLATAPDNLYPSVNEDYEVKSRTSSTVPPPSKQQAIAAATFVPSLDLSSIIKKRDMNNAPPASQTSQPTQLATMTNNSQNLAAVTMSKNINTPQQQQQMLVQHANQYKIVNNASPVDSELIQKQMHQQANNVNNRDILANHFHSTTRSLTPVQESNPANPSNIAALISNSNRPEVQKQNTPILLNPTPSNPSPIMHSLPVASSSISDSVSTAHSAKMIAAANASSTRIEMTSSTVHVASSTNIATAINVDSKSIQQQQQQHYYQKEQYELPNRSSIPPPSNDIELISSQLNDDEARCGLKNKYIHANATVVSPTSPSTVRNNNNNQPLQQLHLPTSKTSPNARVVNFPMSPSTSISSLTSPLPLPQSHNRPSNVPPLDLAAAWKVTQALNERQQVKDQQMQVNAATQPDQPPASVMQQQQPKGFLSLGSVPVDMPIHTDSLENSSSSVKAQKQQLYTEGSVLTHPQQQVVGSRLVSNMVVQQQQQIPIHSFNSSPSFFGATGSNTQPQPPINFMQHQHQNLGSPNGVPAVAVLPPSTHNTRLVYQGVSQEKQPDNMQPIEFNVQPRSHLQYVQQQPSFYFNQAPNGAPLYFQQQKQHQPFTTNVSTTSFQPPAVFQQQQIPTQIPNLLTR